MVRKAIVLSSTLVAMTVMAGCMGSTTTTHNSTSNSNSTSHVQSKSYSVGEEAAAGDIVHKVVSVETMDTIPASATLPDWETIAEDLPAAEGFMWVHINGEVTNNSKESQSVDSTNVYVTDSDDNKFSVSTDTTIYVDSDKSPVYIDVQPTQTVEWEGYFQVPQDAKGLALVGNDLSFLPESEVTIDLGL